MEGATPAAMEGREVLGRYELLDVLTEGPRGTIHLGVDRAEGALPDTQVIVKRMRPGMVSKGWLSMQKRLSLVYHPSLVPVLAAGVDGDGQPCLVMPWRPSMTLVEWYNSPQGQHAPLEAMVALVVDICAALVATHRKGLLHLGIKPSNVLIQNTDEGPGAFLVDFGLPAATGAVSYLAPEIRGGETDQGTIRSDVYGIGMLLLRLLSAGPPEDGRLAYDMTAARFARLEKNWTDRLKKRIEELPAFLVDTIDRALRPDPADRHATIDDLSRELRQGLYASAGKFSVPLEELEEGDEGHIDIRDGLMGELMHERTARGRPVLKFFLRHRDAEGLWRRSGAFFFAPRLVDPRSTYHSLTGAWEGAELSLYHARTATRGEEQFYTHSENTLPILEPYFLVPVTDVIKSQGCASRYLTDLRDSGGTGKALVVGRIVHNMLETLAQRAASGEDLDPDGLFEALYDEAIEGSRMDLLAAGLGAEDMDEMAKSVRTHYDHLQRLIVTADKDLFEGASAEVKRFSGEYGLEGRIDLAFDDGEAFRILELKTGRPNDEHAQQVRCYALLWDKVARKAGKRVVGELLYSKTGKLKPVDREDLQKERRIIQARNGIVSLHRHFAFADTSFQPPHFWEHPSLCKERSCYFRKERCKHQTLLTGTGPSGDARLVVRPGGVWQGIEASTVALARAYYRRFVRFVENEYWNATMTLGHILRGDTLEERQRNLKAVTDLSISEVNAANQTVSFTGAGLQVFSPGQRVIAHRGDFITGQIFTGNIIGVGRGELTMTTAAAPTAQTFEVEDWILDLHPTRIGHRERHRALFDFLRTRDPVRLGLILRRESPPMPTEAQWLSGLDHLNDQQREAVTGAVTAPAAYLIQGPPGTGKTTVIAEIVRQCVARGQRVLLAAGTNTAVDNVLIRLIESGFEDFLRLGSARPDHNLWRHLEEIGKDPEPFYARSLAKGIDDLEKLRAAITAVPVFAATTHMAISSPIMEILERAQHFSRKEDKGVPMVFDVAILDEAGQITEPMALGAINRAKRFVLVGDHQQLPPVVVSDRAVSAHLAADEEVDKIQTRLEEVAGVSGLDQSLFERLFDHVPSTMLEVQYRMHRNLMAYSSRGFYKGKMRAGEMVADLTLPAHRDTLINGVDDDAMRAILSPENPLVLINTKGKEVRRQNEREALIVVSVLRQLLREDLLAPRGAPRYFDPAQAASEIGIVSPFRAQVQLLRRTVSEHLPPDEAHQIEVDTVERFQGREKEIMFVSFVASGRTSDFIANARRLNVTLTRARTKMIVVGNLASLSQTSALFRELIEQAESVVVDLPEAPA